MVGRTQDKSSNVRKNAVQLLTGLMATNPFAAKVSVRVYMQVCVCVLCVSGYFLNKHLSNDLEQPSQQPSQQTIVSRASNIHYLRNIESGLWTEYYKPIVSHD